MKTKTVYVVQWWSETIQAWMKSDEVEHQNESDALRDFCCKEGDGLDRRILKRTTIEEVIE